MLLSFPQMECCYHFPRWNVAIISPDGMLLSFHQMECCYHFPRWNVPIISPDGMLLSFYQMECCYHFTRWNVVFILPDGMLIYQHLLTTEIKYHQKHKLSLAKMNEVSFWPKDSLSNIQCDGNAIRIILVTSWTEWAFYDFFPPKIILKMINYHWNYARVR